MHTPFDASVTPPANTGRRDFARCVAAAGWAVSAGCCIAGQPSPSEPDSAALQRARRSFEALAHMASSLLDLDARAEFVNVAVNQRVDYAPDPASAPGGDIWSTPYETLARGTGDCEDFAITKFFLLLASGVPVRGLRLLYARHRWPDLMAQPVPHLVAVARWPLVDPWVLDCINPLLVALSRRDDLEPVFSFDQSSVWPKVNAEPVPAGRSGIIRWRTTQARTRLQSQQCQTDRRSACPMSTEARMARSKACIERRRWRPPSSSMPPTLMSSAS
jgi:predicted transglutaminase-like cysteine proteinase